jgi:hypothetical protein
LQRFSFHTGVLGNRGWRLGPAGQFIQEAVEHSANFDDIPEMGFRFLLLDHADVATNHQVVFELARRVESDAQEARELFIRNLTSAFDDVGRNRKAQRGSFARATGCLASFESPSPFDKCSSPMRAPSAKQVTS